MAYVYVEPGGLVVHDMVRLGWLLHLALIGGFYGLVLHV